MELAEATDVAALVETVVKTVAVVVGAVWAYYKFIKDRIYRPRFDISIDPEVLHVDGRHYLATRVSVKNIGSSKIPLLQKGTGLRLSTAPQSTSLFAEPSWEVQKVYKVFTHHEWIESQETIREDVAVPVDIAATDVARLEVRIVCGMPRRNITIYGQRVVPLNAGPPAAGPDEDRKLQKGTEMEEQAHEDENQTARWEADKTPVGNEPRSPDQAYEDPDDSKEWEDEKE